MSRSVRFALSLACAACARRAGIGAGEEGRSAQLRHRPCRHSGADRRLGHRRAAGRAGRAAGQGSVKAGEKVYMDKCAACHGEFGESAGRWPQLAQGKGTLASHDPVKTVGSYYPYLSSVFDYIRRAMPFGDAQSLKRRALCGHGLCAQPQRHRRRQIRAVEGDLGPGQNAEPKRLLRRRPRKDAEKAFWNAKPCMKDCRGPVKITGRAQAVDVTPDDKGKKQGGVE